VPYVTVDEISAEAQNGAVMSTQWDGIYTAVGLTVTEAIESYTGRVFTVPTAGTITRGKGNTPCRM